MQYFKGVLPIQSFVRYQKAIGKKVGFVPTMGALHAGHLELISHAKQQCHLSVCSIFVNPTQFNDTSDLEKYPRTLEVDLSLLLSKYNDVVFVPGIEDIYPPNDPITIPEVYFGALTEVMEGAFRPGHFEGVAQVVYRLLDIVEPDYLYMGQKDFQQWTIIDHMIRELSLPIRLMMVETQRESDGLAMSSRNRRLTPAFRAKAPIIYQALQEAKSSLGESSNQEIEKIAWARIEQGGLKPEYIQIAERKTLLPPDEAWNPSSQWVICCAAWAGEIRLIDNLLI